MTTDEQSIGVVVPQQQALELPEGGLVLECGEALSAVDVAFETYGALSESKDNAIFICHALTGDAHVAGVHDVSDAKPGWWEEMVGPGKGIDTNQFFVVCANILGGCNGTTGPSSENPATGRPYGADFPLITVGDMVDVQKRLLDQLGVRHLAAVVGGSLGGMQVLEWSIRFPESVDRCVCIASAASLSAQALAFDIVGRDAIMRDPEFRDGNYQVEEVRPEVGLAQARRIGHITYLSPEIMTSKFGRVKKEEPVDAARFSTVFEVESYLRYQGEKFVDRFDANSYLHITHAMDSYDLADRYGSLDAAFERSQARFLVVALSEDWLFTPRQSIEVAESLVRIGKRVSYCMLEAPHGHDAFLVDIQNLSEVVKTFLEAGTRVPATRQVEPSPQARLLSEQATQDVTIMADMLEAGSSVLDLGCGDGALMTNVSARSEARVLGVDIDLAHVISVIGNRQDVLQQDLDTGLSLIPDGAFDYVVMAETLQVVRRPRFVLQEILRVAKIGIVSFPNFGSLKNRLQLLGGGRMPRSPSLPHEWYDTPNIHLSTLQDFVMLCQEDGVKVLDIQCAADTGFGALLLGLGRRNLGADRVFVKFSRE